MNKQVQAFQHYYLSLFIAFLALTLSSCSDIISDVEDSNDGAKSPFKLIPQEELASWNLGIHSEKAFIVGSYDETEKTTTYLIKSIYEPSDGIIHFNVIDGVFLEFDSDGNLRHVLNKHFSINISKIAEGFLVHWFDNKGDFYASFIENGRLGSNKIKIVSSRANIISLFSPDNLTVLLDWISNIQTTCDFGEDLFTADAIGFLTDLSNLSIDTLLGLAPEPLGIVLSTLKSIVDGMNNSLYERQKKAMYGDCEIYLDEISNDGNGNINCFISIKNANTVPSHLYHLYHKETDVEAQNIVKWGIAGRKSLKPRSWFYTEPYIIEERELDTSNPYTQYHMITFPMPTDGEQYYFAAYLKSYRLANYKGEVNDNVIKYSETYKYSIFDGYINGFSQLTAVESNNEILFTCTVSGTVKTQYDIIEWGFYYKDDSGKMNYFPSKYKVGTHLSAITPQPLEDSQNISFILSKSNFTNINYKEILLGLYTIGGFNLTYNGFSEPQHFFVEYQTDKDEGNNIIFHRNPYEFVDLGLSVKWATNNVGANSIGEPGHYFAWGEIAQKAKNVPYDAENYNFSYPILIDYGNIIGWHFKDIGNSICGTSYDAANHYWGSECRMPSEEEAIELITKCIFITGTENDLTGRWAIGPNNHAIFFPSGGFPSPTINDVKQHHYNARGWYWTGSISSYPYGYTSQQHCEYCKHYAASFFFTTGTSSLGDEHGSSARSMGMNIRPVHK